MHHPESHQSLTDLMKNPEHDFDLVFNEQELQELLAGGPDGLGLGGLGGDAPGMPVRDFPLQLLPPDLPPEPACSMMAPQPAPALAPSVPPSVQSSYDELPAPPPPSQPGSATASASGTEQLKAFGSLLAAPAMDLRALQSLLGTTTLAPPPPSAAVATGLLRPAAQPPAQPPTMRGAKVPIDTKPQISHSSVEKQRRDRINALIDELRDLVPPSKATQAAAAAGNTKDVCNSEARRPKHVVLADTIALLKLLQTRGPLSSLLAGAGAPAAAGPAQQGLQPPDMGLLQGSSLRLASGELPAPSVPIKEERMSPTNSNSKGSVSSHEDMEMKDEARTAAPKLPHIPIQPTLLAGVVVERGPDCMYVQVRCRDRKGLLLDIINALRQMPLEVRTAAVTTQPDGQVRDVFEVCPDDTSLQPEDVQNMVHEALFQQYHLSGEAHKRARSGC